LTYKGADGQSVYRPPGLTDVPGGACGGGTIAALLGILLATQPHQSVFRRVVCLALAVVGFAVIHLTLVRSLYMVTLMALALVALLLFVQGRVLQSGVITVATVLAAAGGLLWSLHLGGQDVADRYATITEAGIFTGYRSNRGMFLEYTL